MYSVTVCQAYTCPEHGKNEADGIGGSTKKTIVSDVCSGRDVYGNGIEQHQVPAWFAAHAVDHMNKFHPEPPAGTKKFSENSSIHQHLRKRLEKFLPKIVSLLFLSSFQFSSLQDFTRATFWLPVLCARKSPKIKLCLSKVWKISKSGITMNSTLNTRWKFASENSLVTTTLEWTVILFIGAFKEESLEKRISSEILSKWNDSFTNFSTKSCSQSQSAARRVKTFHFELLAVYKSCSRVVHSFRTEREQLHEKPDLKWICGDFWVSTVSVWSIWRG